MTRSRSGDERIRCQVSFTGRVQGVGFRYTVLELARSFDVTGIVRNETDGSVELVVEGYRDEIERFLQAIDASRLGRLIRHKRHHEGPDQRSYRRFSVSC